jgi:hypothetical protein
MNRLRNHLIAAAVLSVLAVTGTIMNSRQAAAQGPPNGLAVNIVSPVPLPITGTVSSAITGTVGVTGTVGLASGASVHVNNTAADPVRVRNVSDDEPGRNPFQQDFVVGSTAPGCNTTSCSIPGSFVVPNGKRLVITNVTGQVFATNGPSAGASLTTIAAGGGGVATLSLPSTVEFQGGSTYAINFNLPLLTYLEAGQTVQFVLGTNGTFPVGNRSVRISGYYVTL